MSQQNKNYKKKEENTMKKISLLATASLAAIVLGGGLQAHAAGPGVIESELTQKNKLDFELVADDSTDPKDPSVIPGGGEPVDVPVGPLIPFKGNLAITAVPHLNFGTIKLGGTAATAYQGLFDAEETNAAGDKTDNTKFKPGIRVEDLRGTNVGWTLQVSMEDIKTEEGQVLKGAELTFPAVKIATNNAVKGDGDLTDQETYSATLSGAGQTKTLMHAADGSGRGGNQATYWLGTTTDAATNYGADQTKQISLKVPAGSLLGSYSSNVTYKLTEAPVNNPAN